MELKNTLGYQFRGIFSQLDFDNLHFDKQQDLLVKHEIYIEPRYFMNYVFTQPDFRRRVFEDDFYSVPNRNLSGYEIDYKGVKYSLNEMILKDIFNHIENDVMGDDYVCENIYDTQRKTSILLSKLLTDKEKFDFCVSKYNEYYSKIENIGEIIYFDNIDDDDSVTWEQYVISEIRYNVDLIKKHLFSINYYDTDFVPIFKNWRVLYLSTEMMNFFKAKIKEYQSEPTSSKTIDLSFQISLLEEILNIKDWSEISATKKGEILSNLLGKNKDNIKKIYLEFDKKNSTVSNKFLDDRNKASELIKKTLG